MMARWPDYVLRAALIVILAMVIGHFVISGDGPSKTSRDIQADDPSEQSLLASFSTSEAVWSKVAFVLRRLGHVADRDGLTLADIRTGLKRYQHTIGSAETGTLSSAVLERLLDEKVMLDVRAGRGAQVFGHWRLLHAGDRGCAIATGALSVEGRSLATEMPLLELKVDGGHQDGPVQLAVGEGLFNRAQPVRMSGGGQDLILNSDGGGSVSDAVARDAIQLLRSLKGDLVVQGVSAVGGPLRLIFSMAGFEDGLRGFDETCRRTRLPGSVP